MRGEQLEPASAAQAVTGIATTVIDSLRAQPMMLGVLLINVIFLALIYVGIRDQRTHQHEHMTMLLNRCLPAK
jgi:Flp pilus assembly protein TadB